MKSNVQTDLQRLITDAKLDPQDTGVIMLTVALISYIARRDETMHNLGYQKAKKEAI